MRRPTRQARRRRFGVGSWKAPRRLVKGEPARIVGAFSRPVALRGNAGRTNGRLSFAASRRARSRAADPFPGALMTSRSRPPFRADHVGSFLRPKRLLEARDRKARGEIGASELRAVEDDAIREIVEFQEDVGLQSVTDGEFRRTYFHIDLPEQR